MRFSATPALADALKASIPESSTPMQSHSPGSTPRSASASKCESSGARYFNIVQTSGEEVNT
jgi:hypothetical protein